jgi:hypothetical protein
MTRRETVHSELTQEEKRNTLANDRRVHKNTYFSHAHPDEGGRFAVSDQPRRHVVGSTPMPQYPIQPGGAWSNQAAAVPPEPSLGFSVNELEPLGTRAEIEQSLRAACDGADPSSDPSIASPNGGGRAPPSALLTGVSRRSRRLSRRKG